MAVSLNQRIPSPLRICGMRKVRRNTFVLVFTGIAFSMVTFALKKLELNRNGYTLVSRNKHANLSAIRGIQFNDSTVNIVTNTKTWDNNVSSTEEVTSWKEAIPAYHRYISDFSVMELYHPNSSYLPRLLHDLAVVEIRNTSIFRQQSQFKFLIEFVDGNKAISKPMR
ncbi:hypothetical protein HOLleu_14118 [Holothuria leucospilota]|uniref:Uncharacterized protein n=1 Tax=Holothuria leucospilota TaxID=206669 RepID=A0A9Q1C894_HOLLE|nr:hypothetical protein HOLleu_14118 [Holothuria leucospilota]